MSIRTWLKGALGDVNRGTEELLRVPSRGRPAYKPFTEEPPRVPDAPTMPREGSDSQHDMRHGMRKAEGRVEAAHVAEEHRVGDQGRGPLPVSEAERQRGVPACELPGGQHEFVVGDDRCVFCRRRYDDIYPPPEPDRFYTNHEVATLTGVPGNTVASSGAAEGWAYSFTRDYRGRWVRGEDGPVSPPAPATTLTDVVLAFKPVLKPLADALNEAARLLGELKR